MTRMYRKCRILRSVDTMATAASLVLLSVHFACGILRGFHVHGNGPGPRVAHCVTRFGEYILRPATSAEAKLIQQIYDNHQATLEHPTCSHCGQPQPATA